jgi:hypothetical protein
VLRIDLIGDFFSQSGGRRVTESSPRAATHRVVARKRTTRGKAAGASHPGHAVKIDPGEG